MLVTHQGRSLSTSTVQAQWTAREYSHHQDYPSLCDICKDVYGGMDYLPSLAEEFSSQPDCRFVVFIDKKTDRVDCLGNLRWIGPGQKTLRFNEPSEAAKDMQITGAYSSESNQNVPSATVSSIEDNIEGGVWFIEAIRTRKEARGQGLAFAMVQHLIETARCLGASAVLTSTSVGNPSMERILERSGMVPLASSEMEALGAHRAIFQMYSAPLRELEAEDDIKVASGIREDELAGLVDALGMSDFIGDSIPCEQARSSPDKAFRQVQELAQIQEMVSWAGGSIHMENGQQIIPTRYGCLPSTALSPQLCQAFDTCTAKPEVYASNEESLPAVVIFTENQMMSKKRSSSKMVCTIIARSPEALHYALVFSQSKHKRFSIVCDPATATLKSPILQMPVFELDSVLYQMTF